MEAYEIFMALSKIETKAIREIIDYQKTLEHSSKEGAKSSAYVGADAARRACIIRRNGFNKLAAQHANSGNTPPD